MNTIMRFLAVAALAFGLAGPLRAAVTISVDMDPATPGIQPTRKVAVSETFIIDLVMTVDAAGVSSYGVSVNFDNAELSLNGAPASTELLPAGFTFNFNPGVNSESQALGQVRTFEAGTLGIGPVSTSFVIGRISYTATAPVTDGTADVTLGFFNVGVDGCFDNAGNAVVPVFVGGRVDFASIITWTTSTVTGPADVSTNGTLVGAMNVGTRPADTVPAQNINGVLFQPDPSGLNTPLTLGLATVQFSFEGNFNNNFWDRANPGGSAEYNTALDYGRYGDSPTTNGTVTLGALVVGRQYEVQLWIVDTRSCCSNRVRTVDGVPTTANGANIARGVFVANATTQVISINRILPGAHGPQLNMLQLRELPSLTAGSIANFSFESPTLALNGFTYDVPGWTDAFGTNNVNRFIEHLTNFNSVGFQHLGLELGWAVWQDLGVFYRPNTVYRLRVAAGNRVGWTDAGNASAYALTDSSGVAGVSNSFNASTIPAGTFADAPEVLLDTAVHTALVGRPIRIRLSAGGASRSHFDNVRLEETFVVTTTNDSGAGSLRQVLFNAAAAPGAQTITFATNLAGLAVTLTNDLTVADAGGVTLNTTVGSTNVDVAVNAGTLGFGAGSAWTTNGGRILLGATGGTNAATVDLNGPSGFTLAAPIIVRAGSTGVKTLRAANTGLSGNYYTGAITLLAPATVEQPAGGDVYFTGDMDLGANLLTVNAPGGFVIFNGRVFRSTGTGPAQVVKNGVGRLILRGTGDNTRLAVTVTAGHLDLDKTSSTNVHALGGGLTAADGPVLTVANGAFVVLDSNGGDQIADTASVRVDGSLYLFASETLEALNGSGTAEALSAFRTLTVGAGNGSGIFTGNLNGVGSEALSLTKIGTGTQTVGGGDMSGALTVSNGTLNVLGSLGNISAANVQSGATFAGTGTVRFLTLQSGSFLAPGNATNAGSIGTLTGDVNNTWHGGATARFHLSDVNNTSDRLDAYELSKGSGSNFVFDFQNTGGSGRTYTLVSAANGILGFSASDFTYTNLTPGLFGTFAVNFTNLTFTTPPANVAPSFVKGPDRVALLNSGPQAANAWATAITAGPTNESAQTLTFLVTNDNSALFFTQPVITPNGRLTFTPATNALGSATVSVRLQDNGGTLGGGVDTSAAQTFTISVVSNVPSSGLSIVWVSDFLTNATTGRLPDENLVDLLKVNGHTVTRYNPPDTGAIPAGDVTLLNAANLVILGRSLLSAAFDTAAETAPWNTNITRPILTVNGFLTRSNRLGWFRGNTIPDGLASVLNFNNPSNPVAAAILGNTPLTNGTTTNAVFQQIPLPAGGISQGISANTDLPVPGATSFATTLAPTNGQFLVVWPAGTVLTGVSTGQVLAGYRMQFLAGNREAAVAPDNNVASAGFNNLTVLGETLFLRAVALSGGTLSPSLVVVNTNDSGAGSLRQAVLNAALTPGADTITFAPGFGNIINLASPIALNSDVTINGPGANSLNVAANNTSFRVFDVSKGVTVSLVGFTVTGGRGDQGGALQNNGALTLSTMIFSGNTAVNNGGAIFNTDAAGTSLTATLCVFTGNTVVGGGAGGAIFNHSGALLSLADCTVSSNSTDAVGGSGGGICNLNGTVVLNRCTLSGNTARTTGGGIFTMAARPSAVASVTLSNCTLAGNIATTGAGGGIHNEFQSGASASVALTHCTVSANTATTGGGIFQNASPSASLHLRYSIVAANAGTVPNVDGTIATSTNNLTAGDPLLAPLGYYGGNTLTMALMPGSPARDAATNSTVTSDQRNVSIIGPPDIGAYQAGNFGWETGKRDVPYNAFIWEFLPTTNVAAHGPSVDYDGDGASNSDEFVTHTDPANAASVLRILSITPDNGTNFLIRFSTVPTHDYKLFYSDTVPGVWVPDSTPGILPGDGTDKTITNTPPLGTTNRFYRVSPGGRSR